MILRPTTLFAYWTGTFLTAWRIMMMEAVTTHRKTSMSTACGTPIDALSAPTARLNTSW